MSYNDLLSSGRKNLVSARDAPGHGNESGMGDHAVLGPDAEPLDVPVAHEALHGLDAGEAVVFSQSVHQALHLDYRRQVAQQYATGTL